VIHLYQNALFNSPDSKVRICRLWRKEDALKTNRSYPTARRGGIEGLRNDPAFAAEYLPLLKMEIKGIDARVTPDIRSYLCCTETWP
jgi:hypothetical protein